MLPYPIGRRVLQGRCAALFCLVMSTNSSNDTTARVSGAVLGIIIFLIGVALVGYVFVAANRLFTEPPPQLSTVAVPPPTEVAQTAANDVAAGATTNATYPAVTKVGETLTQFVKQVLVLIGMCIAG